MNIPLIESFMNIPLIESIKEVFIQIGKVYDKDFAIHDLSSSDELRIFIRSGKGNVSIASQQAGSASPNASLQQAPTRKWYRFCQQFNISPDILGKRISYFSRGTRNTTGVVRGIKPRISKYCVILETSSGSVRYLDRRILDRSKHYYRII